MAANAYHKMVTGWVILHPELFVEDRRMESLDVLCMESAWKRVLRVSLELHGKVGGITAEMVRRRLSEDIKLARLAEYVDQAVEAAGSMTADDYEHAMSDVWLATKRMLLMEGIGGAVERLSNRSDESVLNGIAGIYDVCSQVQAMASDEGPELRTMSELARQSVDEYDKPMGIPIPTGFGAIDAATFGGIRPGNLWLLAGYSNQGKTYLAREISFRVAGAGFRVLFCSLEMSHAELREYFLARMAWEHGQPYDVKHAIQKTLHESDLPAYTAAVGAWNEDIGKRVQVWVPERDVDSDDISRRVEIEARRSPLDLVVVDYSELLRSTKDSRRDDYRLRLGDVIRQMKALARRAKTRVLLLHQTSREGFAKALKRGHYVSSELAETGQAERHADVVLWILRSHQQEQQREATIGLAKTRIGDSSCRRGVTVVADYDRGIIADLEA